MAETRLLPEDRACEERNLTKMLKLETNLLKPFGEYWIKRQTEEKSNLKNKTINTTSDAHLP